MANVQQLDTLRPRDMFGHVGHFTHKNVEALAQFANLAQR